MAAGVSGGTRTACGHRDHTRMHVTEPPQGGPGGADPRRPADAASNWSAGCGQSSETDRAAETDRPATGTCPPPRRAVGSAGRGRRGQTTIDFAIGMSVFLISLAFIVAFVPGMLQPFVGGTKSEAPAANRMVDDLSQRLLGNASEPYALDTDCTRAFFDGSAPSACEFDGSTLAERVGVGDRSGVNVSISGDVTGTDGDAILCWDEGGETVVERDSTDCTPGSNGDVLLAAGANPTASGEKTVNARRVVLLDGHDVTIRVVLW